MRLGKVKILVISLLLLAINSAQATIYSITTSKDIEKGGMSKPILPTQYFKQDERVHAFVQLREFDKNTWPQVMVAKWYNCSKLKSVREFQPDTIDSHLKQGVHHVWFWIGAGALGVGDNQVDIYADGVKVATSNFSVLDSDGLQRPCDDGMQAAENNKSEQFLLDTDALFKFNGSKPNELYDSGAQQIDELISKIQSNYKTIDKMTVVGHTDYLGSAAYNLALSQARANTVKGMLINKGIPDERIVTMAKGESVPVKVCEEQQDKTALQECLAPNRRVEVFVVGEKL